MIENKTVANMNLHGWQIVLNANVDTTTYNIVASAFC